MRTLVLGMLDSLFFLHPLADCMFAILLWSQRTFFLLRATWDKPAFDQHQPGILCWTLWYFPDGTGASHRAERQQNTACSWTCFQIQDLSSEHHGLTPYVGWASCSLVQRVTASRDLLSRRLAGIST